MASNQIYVDLYNSKACKSVGADFFTFPTFVAGGKCSYSLRFLEYQASQYLEREQLVKSIRASVGYKNAPPVSGKYKLAINGHQTTRIDWNATAASVEKALNLADPSSDKYEVDSVGGGFVVRKESGARHALVATYNSLEPACSITTTESMPSTGQWETTVWIKQLPLVFFNDSIQVLPEKPSVKVIQHGGTDPSGTFAWPTIQELYIPPIFKGTYQLKRNYLKTSLFDVTDDAVSIGTALNTILKYEDAKATVTNPTNYICQITFGGELDGIDVPPLEVQVFSAPAGDWSFDLDFTSPILLAALLRSDTLTIPLEVEGDFYTDETRTTSYKKKLFTQDIKITSPLITSDLQAANVIDWLDSSRPKDYVPFFANQIITGQQHFTSIIGNGVSTTFSIAHQLNTDAISAISVRENKSNGILLTDTDYNVIINDKNSLTITISSEIAPASNSLAVVITSAGPTSVFQNHTHTVQQIESLDQQLSFLNERVAYLLSLVPRQVFTPPTAVNASPNLEVFVSSFGEVLPDSIFDDAPLSISSQIIPSVGTAPPVPVNGTDLQKEKADAEASLAKIRAENAAIAAAAEAVAIAAAAAKKQQVENEIIAKTPSQTVTQMITPAIGTAAAAALWPTAKNGKTPLLLPALLATTTTPYSSSTLPDLAAAKGKVYASSVNITLPGGNGRGSQKVFSGEHFACDGRAFYKVANGGVNTWHATEMNVELARMVITKDSFQLGSALDFSWNTSSKLIASSFNYESLKDTSLEKYAQYRMQVSAYPIGNKSLEYAGITQSGTVLMDVPFNISAVLEARNYRINLERPEDATKQTTSSYYNYGQKYEGGSLGNVDFVLVVSLTQFDMEHSNEDARGQISFVMPQSQLTITK